MAEPANSLRDFTVFGFATDPEGFLKRRLPARLGVSPRAIKFGAAGHLFLYSSYGDVAESEEAIVLKLGFLRSPARYPLSAQQLLDQKMLGPGFVNNGAFRGNALIAHFSKTKPAFSVFKTLIAVPQLYYSLSVAGIICSDRLRCIANMLDPIELNEDVLPMHFLFRSIPGPLTYFRNVQRMLPGQFLKWADGELGLRLVQSLRFADDDLSFTKVNRQSLDFLYDSLRDVVSDYVTQIETAGHSLANLLSGGVDSSLVQYLINQRSSKLPSRSFSFAARAPSFESEIENARQASQLFQTEHTFVDFHPEDYPGLLTRTIDILAQPPVLATEPSVLAVAELVHEVDVPARFFFSGQGADALFGLEGAKKLKGLNYLRRVPAAVLILKGVGTILKPVSATSRVLLKGAEILACMDDPDAYVSPSNTIAVYTNLETVRRCFGDRALRLALEYRRDLAAQYLNSGHYLEKIYVIDLLTDAYEVDAQRHQLFLAHHRAQLHPFLDEDVLRTGFAFHPDVRYIGGLRNKHLLKAILEQKTDSPAARKPKGFSVFESDWYTWMRSGPLRPLIQDIHLPGFLSRADYEQMAEQPDYFLWELLVFDIFQKRVLRA